MTLQLRYLQTLTEIAVENNSTVVFPVPLGLSKPFSICRNALMRCNGTVRGASWNQAKVMCIDSIVLRVLGRGEEAMR